MTKSTATTMRESRAGSETARRLPRCGFGKIAALALAVGLAAGFAPATASAQNGNADADAPSGAGPDGTVSVVAWPPSAASAPDKLSPVDQQFIQDAGTAGATEIAASRMALTNSSDEQVKSFAQQMIADHTRLARNLDIVAKRHGITAAPNADASVTGSLESLHGGDFDKAYIEKVALNGHQKAVAVFSTESKSGNDVLLKNAAVKALPIIKHHYAMAQQLAKLKGISS
jgi:putative membrane protein